MLHIQPKLRISNLNRKQKQYANKINSNKSHQHQNNNLIRLLQSNLRRYLLSPSIAPSQILNNHFEILNLKHFNDAWYPQQPQQLHNISVLTRCFNHLEWERAQHIDDKPTGFEITDEN